MFEALKAHGIDCKIVVAESIGVVLETVDYVVSGAEVVTENGGVINHVGTYTLAICASVMKKPMYIFAEDYKFLRAFIVNQNDIPREVNHVNEFVTASNRFTRFEKEDSLLLNCDFTPHSLISFIVSDSKVLKSSCVSDEFLDLFNL